MENQSTQKDSLLWEEARERVRFRRKVLSYLVFSAFFWIVWYFTDRSNDGMIPWPAWAMLGWGLGLVFRYIRIMKFSESTVEDEYRRLKEKRGQ
jgi:hypothetical protein